MRGTFFIPPLKSNQNYRAGLFCQTQRFPPRIVGVHPLHGIGRVLYSVKSPLIHLAIFKIHDGFNIPNWNAFPQC